MSVYHFTLYATASLPLDPATDTVLDATYATASNVGALSFTILCHPCYT